MEQEDMSCIDCAVKNCSKMDKTYPDFCLTTHMDQKVLEEAMACYEQEEVRQIAVAAAEVEYLEVVRDYAPLIPAAYIGDTEKLHFNLWLTQSYTL